MVPSKTSFVILAVTLLTVRAGMWWVSQRPDPPDGFANHLLPSKQRIDRWIRLYTAPLAEDAARVLGSRIGQVQKYASPRGTVEVVVVLFADQKFEAQMHSPLHCLPGAGWKILHLEPIEMASSGWSATYAVAQKGPRIDRFLYWFTVNGKIVKNIYQLKWEILKKRLLRRPIVVAFYRFDLQVAKSPQSADAEVLIAFARAYLRAIASNHGNLSK